MPRLLRIASLTLALVAAAASWTHAQGGAGQKPPDRQAGRHGRRRHPEARGAGPGAARRSQGVQRRRGREEPAEARRGAREVHRRQPEGDADAPQHGEEPDQTERCWPRCKDSRAKYLALAENEHRRRRRSARTRRRSTRRTTASRRGSSPPASTPKRPRTIARKGLAAHGREDVHRESARSSTSAPWRPTRSRRPTGRTASRSRRPRALRLPRRPGRAAAAPQPPAPELPASHEGRRHAGEPGAARAARAPATPPRPPATADDADRRRRCGRACKSERASAQATLGQILMKRGKTDEGEKVLAEAYAAKPASSTMATIAQGRCPSRPRRPATTTTSSSTCTVLALSGRVTAGRVQGRSRRSTSKTHNGSLDGLEAMLDERYRRDTRAVRRHAVRAPGQGEADRADGAGRGLPGRGLTAVRGGGSRLRCRARTVHPAGLHRAELPRPHPAARSDGQSVDARAAGRSTASAARRATSSTARATAAAAAPRAPSRSSTRRSTRRSQKHLAVAPEAADQAPGHASRVHGEGEGGRVEGHEQVRQAAAADRARRGHGHLQRRERRAVPPDGRAGHGRWTRSRSRASRSGRPRAEPSSTPSMSRRPWRTPRPTSRTTRRTRERASTRSARRSTRSRAGSWSWRSSRTRRPRRFSSRCILKPSGK